NKVRIIVLLSTNATGTHQLKPWVIGKSLRLRYFKCINLNSLPIEYRANEKAWMHNKASSASENEYIELSNSISSSSKASSKKRISNNKQNKCKKQNQQ
ncbi:6291_t:CDS:2, partial [Scutellospora calospora]